MVSLYYSFIVVLWINTITTFLLGMFVLLKNRQRIVNKVFSFYSIGIAWWSFCEIWGIACDKQSTALFWTRIEQVGVFFIPSSFVHFVISLLEIKNKKWIIRATYFFSLVFAILSFTPYMIADSIFRPNMPYVKHFGSAGFVYHFAVLFFIILSIYGLLLLWKDLNSTTNENKREQLKLLFWSCLGSYVGGMPNFLLVYNISIPILNPYGTFLITIYISVVTYAIVQYRLFDIRVAISNAVIFIGVYALVLGVPFYFGYKFNQWQTATWFMLILATIGPFIYLYIQKKAEDRLLQEQRRYQATLRQASAGMGKIKDLKKLLNMIVYVLTHAIQIEHALVYIYDEPRKKYVLGASKRRSGFGHFIDSIEKNSPLIDYLSENKNSLIFEEITQKALDTNNHQLIQIKKNISSLGGALVVPVYVDQDLTAIIVMGKRESGNLYSEDDLSVFSILANQTALAIENAMFYEKMKLTHEQLFQAEKMATIGTMADGLSHQINNRFHALGFIAGDAIDTIRMNQKELSQDEMKKILAELERSFVRVQDNVVQGGEIVSGLLRYTRKGEAGFIPVDIEAVFKAALEMVQFKIKMHELKIIRDYDITSIPKIKGNFTQLQEVFFNLIDNGYDAMMQRKNEKKEPGYQATLIVRVVKEDGFALIIFEDNGIGVKDDDMHKLFTPFFTTKLSSKKGTGLGLYVIKKIVEDNHQGEVEMVSKYMQGTQMKLRLPIAIE